MEEEIDILKSIYFDDIINVELNCDRPYFEMIVYPSDTDNEELSRKRLRLNLIIYFPPNYPNEIPKFDYKFVKGITDEDLAKIVKEAKEIADKSIGTPMLFEIIQYIKDHLNNLGNIPKSCKCSICLCDFNQSENVTNLECYHYFHTKCLITHMIYAEEDIEKERLEAERHKIKWKQRNISCPVCREPIKQEELDLLNKTKSKYDYDLDNHKKSMIDNNYNCLVVISKKMRQIQEEMKAIYDRQRSAGGIIEGNKQEIIILTRPVQANSENENLE